MSVQVALTKYYKLGGLETTDIFFPYSFGGWKVQEKRASFLVDKWLSSPCVLAQWKG